jgi:hypothetical protein
MKYTLIVAAAALIAGCVPQSTQKVPTPTERARRELEPNTAVVDKDADAGETSADGRNYKYDPTARTFYYLDAAGKTVHVNGYYRKDGTYVQPHDRAAPGAGKVGGKGGKRK